MRNVLTRLWVCLIFFIALSLGSYSYAYAQPQANFSASPVSGCSPIIVNFTDQSSGNPTQWKWDLGNGVISFLQNPSATYFSAGTYNVKLVVWNASGSDSITRNQYITVDVDPSVNFSSSDSIGCIPLPVHFTSNCSAGSGTITNYNWDFGDGVISALQNPVHTYSTSGNFSVALRVTNSHGCITTFTKTNFIQIGGAVHPDFTISSQGTCSNPSTIDFTNTSTGPAPLSYVWNFGDGTTSMEVNPSHVYNNAGTYTVSLIAISPQGCADTIVKTNLITIGAIHSEFISPDTVCESTIFSITNLSTPVPPNLQWDFGNGTFSGLINPVKSYSSTGTFIIKLINYFGACNDTATKSIVVISKPSSAFTANQTSSCMTPFTVNFANQSSGGNTYLWKFGDGSTSTAQNPIHTYSSFGNFTVTLTTTNANGCIDSLVKTDFVKIIKPGVTIDSLPQHGCVPLTINPTATIVATQPIASYQWSFGDGTTSTAANPGHTYTTAGTYSVSLIITTAGGCSDTATMTNAVRVGNKPTAAFTLHPPDDCAYHVIGFADNSTGNVDEWLWIYGDGGTSSIQNPAYMYSDTGYFTVTLIAGSNTCLDTFTIANAVHIRPPVASFTITNSCTDKYHKDFTDHSIGATSWQWDFGDGSSSTLQSPSHIYATTGIYTVSLTVMNGSCSFTKKENVKVINEQGTLSADHDHQCKNGKINFDVNGVNSSNITSWQWDFGDGNNSTSVLSVAHTYSNSGNYIVTLVLTDTLGCKDTLSMRVAIYGPKALFSSSIQSACIDNSSVLFTDSSTTDGSNPIVQWTWDYADGTIDSITTAPFVHNYIAGGTYPVSLYVKDNFGCSSQFTVPVSIIIYQPKANFSSADTLSCLDKPIHFIDSSTGGLLTYQWQFGDGNNSVITNPVHNYLNSGIYSVKLKVTDQHGCSDSTIKNNYISISIPHASFTVSDSVGSCHSLSVNFTNTSTGYNSLSWDFGDGNHSNLSNPSHYYATPGIFYAKLFISASGGCTDSVNKKIEVHGPQGSFTYNPQIGCKPTTVSFTANTQNNNTFIWDFSDGTILSTHDSVVTHIYTAMGDFIPKMILNDSSGCTVPISGTENIHVTGVTVNFQPQIQSFCDSGIVNLQNNTVSSDPVTNWQWSFGDGTTSNLQQPVHHYNAPGVFSLKLTALTEHGCRDSLVLIDTVKIFGGPFITVAGDTAACAPATMSFTGQTQSGSAQSWQWNLGNGQTDYNQIATAQYLNAGTYNVICKATDQHGCKDSVARTVFVHPVPTTTANSDAMICKGASTQLAATGALTYCWSPATGLSCVNCGNPIASPTDTINYVVTGTNSFGCSNKDSVHIDVKQPFLLKVSPGDSICIGATVQLSASGADQYSWFPSSGLNHPNSAITKAHPASTTLYSVVGKDKDNCFSDTATVLIVVVPYPNVNAGNDITITSGTPGQLAATGSQDVTSWSWTPQYYLSCFTCPAPKAVPKQSTTYTVTAKNSAGCATKDEVTVFVTCNKGNLFIPNTFSPNGDGMNDRFYPRGTGIGTIRSLRVFNRWGELVYEKINFNANDAGSGWDGTYKGHKLSPDVFIYTCEVVCDNNEVMMYKGDVTLIQ